MLDFSIVTKEDHFSRSKGLEIRHILNSLGCKENNQKPALIITVGGDGTMLRAIHQYLHLSDQVTFLGVHTGTLGFYTSYLADEIEQMCRSIVSRQLTYHEFNLLEIEINQRETYYALNEFRLENVYHTQTIQMYMNDAYLQTFKGNGVCVSTSIGSTGYNRSLGGPIVEFHLPVLIMTEIAGIHHREHRSLGSSLVMNSDTKFKMILSDNEKSIIGIDHMTKETTAGMEITCSLSDKTVKLAYFDELTYQKRLYRAFLENPVK